MPGHRTTRRGQCHLDINFPVITDGLIAAFKSVYDPEIPVDIYELGLIYKVDIDDD
ncbi:MAG: iron-sulfur cluster assembly protein, partial [Pseudomonadota bacterium]